MSNHIRTKAASKMVANHDYDLPFRQDDAYGETYTLSAFSRNRNSGASAQAVLHYTYRQIKSFSILVLVKMNVV